MGDSEECLWNGVSSKNQILFAFIQQGLIDEALQWIGTRKILFGWIQMKRNPHNPIVSDCLAAETYRCGNIEKKKLEAENRLERIGDCGEIQK